MANSIRRRIGPPGWLLGGLLALVAAGAGAQPLTAGGGWLEENNVLFLEYRGTWHSNLSERHSGLSATQSTEPGATLELSFVGTGFRWIGFRDEWSGIAAVFVDGQFLTTVDTYASPAQYQAIVLERNDLPPGTHHLTLQVLDTRSGPSGGAWVWVDAIEVLTDGSAAAPPDPWAGAVRSEQDQPSVAYAGKWFGSDSEHHSGGSATLALDAGARATFSFTGGAVRWIGYRDEWSGIGRVYLDGSLVAYVDLYRPSFEARAVLFSAPRLAPGPHTIAVEATHDRNADALQRWVWLDAFDVVP
ncbi:MAG: hypothetical protein AB7O37_13205 [Vicinamibacteria bacterium]